MIDSYEAGQELHKLHEELEDLEKTLDTKSLKEEIDRLNKQTEALDFWNDTNAAQAVLKQITFLKEKQDKFKSISDKIDDLDVMMEFLSEGEEVDELGPTLKEAQKEMQDFKLETLLTGEYDQNNAIINFHPGSGGTESNDWAEMLLRMYMRWAESRGFKVKVLDLQPGGVAGIKSASLLIEGTNAYGYLKTEKGVHRLVRISPFDTSNRRHTSFASLDVTPEVDESIEIEINPDDLRIDTFRSSGKGGQHVNKTDSAIRITHLPTGIVVSCQNERSQLQNKNTAMTMLKSKLISLLEEENKEKLADLKGDYGQITWGNQIRSYVFQPYTLVKDHRTNVEQPNVTAVMDGQIDPFINASLLKAAKRN